MKYFILSNQSRSMSIFWRVLIRKMIEKGNEVVCCAPGSDAESERALNELGARFVACELDRKGLNPFRDIGYYINLKKIFRQEKPDLLFASTIKPVIYGCAAASAVKVPAIFATITGLGYVFEGDNIAKKGLMAAASAMYRHSLSRADGVFFQNHDDYEKFKSQRALKAGANALFARGTGVDVQRFAQAEFPPLSENGQMVFLLAGRLLKAKGIMEYAEAARMLKKNWPNARFQILGIPEKGPGAAPLSLVQKWHDEGVIEYLGESRDIRPHLAASHVAALPSWREGVPTFLMEAMSMGRPCVATDVPGCRETVKNGKNGLLSPVGDSRLLAENMEFFLKNPQAVTEMGAESRRMAVEEFDAEKVAEGIISDMNAAMKKKTDREKK